MSESPLVTVDDRNFEDVVLQAKEPVLVDVTATWCGPCRALKPVVERLAAENAGKVKVALVDIDESPAVATRYGIRGAPTLLVFKGGELAARHVGVASKERILQMLAL